MTAALRVVSRHLPEPEGTAAGRHLIALCEGFLELGASLRLTSWRDEPPADPAALPAWCEWRPLGWEPRLHTRVRALGRPRWDAVRLNIDVAPGEVPLADDPESWPAVAAHRDAVATLHFSAALDGKAVGARGPKVLQDIRAQRRMLRQAKQTLAQSERTATWARARGARVTCVPIALRPPPLLPNVPRPIVTCLADWRWPPNQVALSTLLRVWPQVRRAVPGAELVLAGRGDPRVGGVAGVRVLGVVPSALDVLAQASVLAFACPPSSGPKVKVLEAVMAGRPVVTTPYGVEGLSVGSGAIVADEAGFGKALASALREAAEGSSRGLEGRTAALAVHAPVPAARARLCALETRSYLTVA